LPCPPRIGDNSRAMGYGPRRGPVGPAGRGAGGPVGKRSARGPPPGRPQAVYSGPLCQCGRPVEPAYAATGSRCEACWVDAGRRWHGFDQSVDLLAYRGD